ncbi:glycosyl hydrolase [Mucilaginibacter sp.]|uniref:glycoside hydrolase family 26 protein n=1 Tax=Mucilaginibacter sp. TaxID=1882438 RepID=UPI003263FF1A
MPVTTNASPEAKALLQFLYSIDGKFTLTGQHNFPAAADKNSKFAAHYSGKTPVVFGTDFGFAKAGDKDSHLLRESLVKEAERQYKMGAIVALCWHAVPPTANEPVTFQPLPGADPANLASVQGQLTDQQFKDVLTPGTELYNKWAAQVDSIAFYLKKLQVAHVPVLWRPYHEMNGNWFWWGNRVGQYSTQALYRQMFDRFVKFHKLNNLIWVWSVDRPSKPGMEFEKYYPGDKYLDIVALDVYGSDFKQDYYDQLVSLSKGKPLALAEVGNPPSSEILGSQPRWGFWMIWAGMVRNTTKKQYEAFANNPRILGLNDAAYIDRINPFRVRARLSPLPLITPADFNGEWVLNEDKSNLNAGGTANLSERLTIAQSGDELHLRRLYTDEWSEPQVRVEKLKLDGRDIKAEGVERITTAKLSGQSDTLSITFKLKMNFGGQSFLIKTSEIWNLQNKNKELHVIQTTSSPRGETRVTLVYDRISYQ